MPGGAWICKICRGEFKEMFRGQNIGKRARIVFEVQVMEVSVHNVCFFLHFLLSRLILTVMSAVQCVSITWTHARR